MCVWIDLPICESYRGLKKCYDLGYNNDQISWHRISYVLVNIDDMEFSWIDGQYCYYVPKLENFKSVKVLRTDNFYFCEDLNGAIITFCVDIDCDLIPDICSKSNF